MKKVVEICTCNIQLKPNIIHKANQKKSKKHPQTLNQKTIDS